MGPAGAADLAVGAAGSAAEEAVREEGEGEEEVSSVLVLASHLLFMRILFSLS